MTSLLIAVFAAYVTAAIHSVLAFAYKRQSLERTAFLSLLVGFCLHTAALILDWVRDGHYPFFGLKEAASFLAWTLVATYGLTAYRYRTPSLGAFTTPLISLLTLVA